MTQTQPQTAAPTRPLEARKGDVLNPDRTWGIVELLSREACIEIDGDDSEYGNRTTVVAEVCAADNSTDERDARLLAAAWNSYQRHCADPLAAAESDLLGEALGTLACIQHQAIAGEGTLDENGTAVGAEDFAFIIQAARSLLARTEDRSR